MSVNYRFVPTASSCWFTNFSLQLRLQLSEKLSRPEAPGRGAGERLVAPGEAEEVAAAAAAAQHDRGTTGLGGRCRGAWGGGGGGAVTWRNKDGWIDWTV